MLMPISETFQHDINHKEPTNKAIYPTPPGPALGWHADFTKGQPFDYYKQLHEEAPVSWHDIPMKGADGFWALTKYEDIKYAELNPQIFSSMRGGINMTYGARIPLLGRLTDAALNTLICMDHPYHVPFRMQHRDFFTPKYIGDLKEKVDMKVEQLLDKMEKDGPVVDMVTRFSEQLPLFTLCEMMGIEEKDRPKVTRWMHYLERVALIASDGEKIDVVFLAKFLWNVRQMFRYGERVLNERRSKPEHDLMTAIAQARVEDEELTQKFLDGAWLLIIFAGNDTTRNSLSGTMRLLTQFPDQKQMLLDDPSLIPTMVPEALRMVSPVIHMRRTVTQDVEIRGQKISEGEKVVLWYGAGNRDEEQFPDSDRFDIMRENAREHIAFGHGPHVCLGQRIATMQLQAAYEQILARFPNVKWTGKQDIAPNNFVSAISHLQIDLGTA